MITGVLSWFRDDDPKTTLAQKMHSAASVYHSKRGVRPSVVYMHPSIAGEVTEIAGMAVKQDTTVQRNHFYLGE